jgi:transposase
MATYRRHSTAFKLQLVHAYLNGEGSYKELAARHGIGHSLLLLWVRKFQAGEITEEQDQSETVREYEAKIAVLERKVGQLTMQLDVLKKITPALTNTSDTLSIIVGPKVSPLRKDAK